jgi:hypothetical protein
VFEDAKRASKDAEFATQDAKDAKDARFQKKLSLRPADVPNPLKGTIAVHIPNQASNRPSRNLKLT